jgi:hypothetical protein
MKVLIYVIFQFHCIFVQIDGIILTKVKEIVMNFAACHMDTNLSVFVKSLIIIYVIMNVLFLGNLEDAIGNAH